jgi:hypothetical protein
MGLLLKSTKPELAEQAGEVTQKLLANLALRYAGDNGNTVAGTAEAMAFMSKIRMLSPGDTIKLPKLPSYYIEVTA